MKLTEIINCLEAWAPLEYQEGYDNSGLIYGNRNKDVSKALISLDCTEAIIDEAIEMGAELVISHHPIVFSGIKSLTGKNYIERTLIKAIQNDIAIYAIHTNLDNVQNGVNQKIAQKLGLNHLRILDPKPSMLQKLVFFCPIEQSEVVRKAVFEAGGGQIGKYDSCSFNAEGIGTFKAGEGTTPYVGQVGELHHENELKIEIVVPKNLMSKVLKALLKTHPYEEVAYDIYSLDNKWDEVGSGMIGELDKTVPTRDFLNLIKKQFDVPVLRCTDLCKKEVNKVAVCGGSGSFLLNKAIAQKADVFITADYKYHQFFDAEQKIIIVDMGHYESEQFTMDLIQEHLKEKMPNFATYLTKRKTNPINYI